MAQRSDRLDGTAMLLMVALCALWGMNQVSIKVANTGISPVFQAAFRSAGAAGLLWLWARWRGVPLFQRDGTLGMGLLTAVLFAGEFTLLYGSLEFTNASRARAVVFLYLAPFVVAIGGHLTIPGERLRFSHGLGLVSAFAGMTIAFADALRLPTHRELLGDAMALAAAIFWGVTTVVVKASRLARASPPKVLFYQLAGSAVVLLALAALLGERGVFAPTPLVIAAFLYQTVIIAFVSYLAWFWLITRHTAFQLSSFSFLTPLFGLAAGGVLLGEPITPALTMAMVLVGAGIYLVNRSPAARRANAVPASGD
jgi:drug/metabolite transporter (DMT)-like permease